MILVKDGNDIFYGTIKEWLDSMLYDIEDVLNDEFATNFCKSTIKERMDRGECMELPEFKEGLPF